MPTYRVTSPQLVLVAILLTGGIFGVDLSLPRGFVGGIPYLAVVLLGWWHPNRRAVFLAASVSTVLVLLGYLFSPPGSPEWMVLTNRAMAVLALWLMAALMAIARNAQDTRRDREQRLGLVLDNSVSGIITIDEQGLIQSANRAAENIFGYTFDEIGGRNINTLMPEPYQSEHDGYLANYLRTGEAKIIGIGREVEGLRKDGHRFPLELGVSEMVVDGRRVFTGIVQDITERKQTEDQLRQALKMEAVGHLTGGIAHDFNNLLAVILSNLELLKDQIPPGGHQASLLDRALQAAERGALLTDRLLAFSRIQKLEPQRHQLNRIITDMMGLLRSSLGETVTINLELAEELWPTLVDAGQMENALLNLALNARDAMKGGGRLTLETANTVLDSAHAVAHEDATPGDYVVLTVTDTGGGMAPEVLAQVFEPFYSTKDAGAGSGLGLSMVYGFASQSGGHAAITSDLGQGTAVKIYLPRADDAGVLQPTAQPPQVEARGQAQSILVVEDYDDLRDTAMDLLSGAGYNPIGAKDGPSALGILAGNPEVALLFTDVVLPGGMSGIELAREASRRHPGLKVLITSGYTEKPLAAAAESGIVMERIEKPYKLSHLSRKVAALLRDQ